MTAPTVHLNGTSRRDLEQQLEDAAAAVRTAIKAVDAAAPNGRDYYPQGYDAIRQATAEHAARVGRLADVLRELEDIRMAMEE